MTATWSDTLVKVIGEQRIGSVASYAKFSQHGRYVTFESLGTVCVVEVHTKQEIMRFPGRNPRWIGATTLTYAQATHRYEVCVEPVSAPILADELPFGVSLHAENNHWMAVPMLPSGGQILMDGHVVETVSDSILHADMRGDFVAYALRQDGKDIIRVRDVRTRVVVRDIEPHSRISSLSMHAAGHVGYSGAGRARIATCGGTDIEVTAAPLAAECHIRLFGQGDDLWVSTSFQMAKRNYVLLRPVGSDVESVTQIEYPVFPIDFDWRWAPEACRFAFVTTDWHGDVWLSHADDLPRARVVPAVETPTDNRKWAGYWHAFGSHGHWPEARENCTIITEAHGITPAILAGRKIIIDDALMEQAQPVWEHVVAVQVRVNQIPLQKRDVASARQYMIDHGLTSKPIMTLHRLPDLRNVREFFGDWVGVLALFEQPQTDEQLESYWDEVYRLIPADKQIVIHARASDCDYQWTNERELVSLTPKLFAPLYDEPRTIGIFWYAFGVPGGTAYYSRMREWHEALVDVLVAPE